MPQTRRASRDAALVELQRLHAAILASRARRGVGPDAGPIETPSREALAARELTRRLQSGADAAANDVEPGSRSRRGWWLAVAAAVVVAGAWAAMTLTQRREVVTEAAPTSPAAASTAAPPREVAPPAPAVPAKAIRVTLELIRPVWLRITVDGAPAHEGELPAGQKITAEGDRDVRVRAGDAGGVRAITNGVDRGPLGRDGWPLTVSITPEGIKALTPTRPEP